MQPLLHTAFVALGSNLDDRTGPIETATLRLTELSRTPLQRSHLYDTSPMYLEDQPRFLNGVVKLTTNLEPELLLSALLNIETQLGRVRAERNGPRVIDLDLLLWDDVCCEGERLTLPHPRLAERPFVLCPLAELAPELVHPRLGRRMDDLWRELSGGLHPSELPVRTDR